MVNPDAADLLLRWGADETAVDRNGATPAAVIRRTDEAPEEHPTILRLVKWLEFADQDRTWRRRGLLVMCRAHPDRLRLVAHVSTNNTSESVGEPREGRNCRTKREERVETTTGDGGLGSGSGAQVWSTARRTGSVGKDAGLEAGPDGVLAWLMTQSDEGVFRNIVRFLYSESRQGTSKRRQLSVPQGGGGVFAVFLQLETLAAVPGVAPLFGCWCDINAQQHSSGTRTLIS